MSDTEGNENETVTVTPPAGEAARIDPPQETDWQAEARKWKDLSRKHEGRAKDNANAQSELDRIKASQLSETEKAVKEAEDRGRAGAALEYGQRVAAAEVKAALTGLIDDPARVVSELNLAKYVTDTGEVDSAAIDSLKETFAGFAQARPTSPDLKQGRQGEQMPGQLTLADVKSLRNTDPEALVRANQEGRLNALKGIN